MRKFSNWTNGGPTVRVPAYFFVDHLDRLPQATPEDFGGGKKQALIAFYDPRTSALLDDARYYSDPYGPGAGDPDYAGLRASARATVKAIEKVAASLARDIANGHADSSWAKAEAEWKAQK